jgi:CheY-like chemotaxis protein
MKADLQENERSHMTRSQPSQSLGKHRILYVDDNLACLEARAALLEEEGYVVTTVNCPLMALKCDVSEFHLAILDFDMPGLNGFELLLRLRAAHASFPIMLLSGMARDLPNDMRRVFTSCHDKGEPVHLLLNALRSYLNLAPDPSSDSDARPLYRRHGS